MSEIKLRTSTPEDGERVVAIWRSAVDATHDFLTAEDRAAIEEEVKRFLPQAPLWLALDDDGRAIGFIGLGQGQIDSLFIDASHRGRGVGSALVRLAASLHPSLVVDVN